MKLIKVTFEGKNECHEQSLYVRLEYKDPRFPLAKPLKIRVFKDSAPELFRIVYDNIKESIGEEIEYGKTYLRFNNMPFYINYLGADHYSCEGKVNAVQEIVKLTPQMEDGMFVRGGEYNLILQDSERDEQGNYMMEGYLEGWLPRD